MDHWLSYIPVMIWTLFSVDILLVVVCINYLVMRFVQSFGKALESCHHAKIFSHNFVGQIIHILFIIVSRHQLNYLIVYVNFDFPKAIFTIHRSNFFYLMISEKTVY